MAMLDQWAPLPDLDVVERRMRRFFEDLGVAPAVTPAANVYETGDELVVELEVPGFDEQDLTVAVSDHTLSISGERTDETSKTEQALRVRERLEAHFERRFRLPPEADAEHVTAEYAKGVLTLHVPKGAAAKHHKVKIGKK
ncbi:MAG TPA: Hsp20/alpha crystallin family protein [Gaiellaceae bacterium]|nr:Hsp20/alpha crystallin family protein [Gaiellaceae bacterium]